MPEESRPAIVVVDDEPAVLAAVARDLRRRFGEDYRILRAGSGPEALELLREVRARGDQVALLIADQRMPVMAGTEYLVEARTVFPDAKRALLTAYADTEAAIAAINEVALDYYLLKPWDPPEEEFFPVVEDLLETWQAGAALLESGGVRVIGHRFSKESREVRDFLARNRVLRAGSTSSATPRRASCSRSSTSMPTGCRWPCSRTGRCWSGRRCSSSLSTWASAPSRSRSTTTWSSSAAACRAGRGGLRRLRGAAHRDGRARDAGRAGGEVDADRATTWASRPA